MTTKTSQHTPGPWETEGLIVWAPGAQAVIAAASELRASQTVRFTEAEATSPDFHEIAANARLIAAAPALLEALERLLKSGQASNVEFARAAIAQAKGETE